MPPSESESARWFREHVLPHEPMVRGWLRGRLTSETDVDDVVQEAYVRLLRARERQRIEAPKAFLFTIVRNLARDHARHREVLPLEPLAEEGESAVFTEEAGPPETVAQRQELELLTEAIQSLPDRCRQIFTLRKVYGLPQAEIARQLGLSENTVSAQLTIGVRKCMAFLDRYRREREGRGP
ncbi:MAG: RNA polymerase sigma factor [Opitutaceae bacterium]|jgi:RNA polymerase sigma-70 factor (ECF subfamily)